MLLARLFGPAVEPTDPSPGIGRVRLRTLVTVRWIAVAGQLAAVVVAQFALGFDLPLDAALTTIAASGFLNLALMLYRPAAIRLRDAGAAGFLAFDMAQLSALLHLTGGLTNPFAPMMLAPIAVSATILSRQATIALYLFSAACVGALWLWHEPLAWPGGTFEVPDLYRLGMGAAVVLGSAFLAVYAGSVAEEQRRMADALVAAQAALEREQRLSALGTLAAAAAHELGTPLATIAVVAREIARDLPAESPLAEDARTLSAETARCRDILARLAAKPEPDEDPFAHLPLSALVEAAGLPYRRPGVTVRYSAAATPGAEATEEPVAPRAPETMQGLGNLIQNAVQFARSRVDVRAAWSAQWVDIEVDDDGPGFASTIIDRLGDPYVSSRGQSGDHMGLGVFIAKTLLERSGAQIEFANRRERGGAVRIRWPRTRFEAGPR